MRRVAVDGEDDVALHTLHCRYDAIAPLRNLKLPFERARTAGPPGVAEAQVDVGQDCCCRTLSLVQLAEQIARPLLDRHADGLTLRVSEQDRGVFLPRIAAAAAAVAARGTEGQWHDDTASGRWHVRVPVSRLYRLEQR